MPLELVTTDDRFAALGSDWNALLERSSSDSIFLSWEWTSNWWTSYKSGRQLFVLVSRDDQGMCQGIAPLYAERASAMGLPCKRLRFLGDGSHDSDYLDFILASGREREILAAFLDKLRSLSSLVDVLQVNEILASSPTVSALSSWGQRHGWLERIEEMSCAVLQLPETWAEYLNSLRPRFRTTVRACLRNAHQWQGAVECLTQESQIDEWLEQLFSLHTSRWSLRDQSGVFGSTAKRNFYRAMARAFFERGWLHMIRWRVRDTVLACQFGFIYRETYHLLQEGFRSECLHVNPGTTLRAAKIRDLIENGIRRYDFLGGLSRHKIDWGAMEKKCVRIAAAPRTLVGTAYVAGPQRLSSAKEWIKQRLPSRFLASWQKWRRGAPDASGESRSPAPEASTGAGWRELVAVASHQTGALSLVRMVSRHRELRTSKRGGLQWKTAQPKFLILCYHRVGTEGVPLHTSMRPEFFEAQMRFLRRHYRVVSLSTMSAELASGDVREPGVVVTFDDGYRDLYEHAFPILRKYSLPATLFVIAGAAEFGQVAWYDRIFLALRIADQDKIDLLLDQPRRFLLMTPELRLRSAIEIVSHLRKLPDELRKECCAEIEKQIPLPEDQLANRMLTWEQMRTMHNAGVAFGSHTMTHPVVSRLSPEALRWELSESKSLLESRLQCSVNDFAFPFGHPADCGTTAAGFLSQCGYRTGATTTFGVNTPGVDPYALKRAQIGEGQSLPMFALQIARLFLQVGQTNGPAQGASLPRMAELPATSSANGSNKD